MRTLSIKQPWASLIVYGFKDIENRSWHCGVENVPLLIHAGKKPDDWTLEELRKMYRADIPLDLPLATGAIIGQVHLVGCTHESESPWYEGEHGFVVRDPVHFGPFDWRGQLGFFDVDINDLPW